MEKLFKNPAKGMVSTLCISCLLLVSLLSACEDPAVSEEVTPIEAVSGKNSTSAFPQSGNLVEVISSHLNFNMPDELLSGWNTFRYNNQSHNVHLFLFEKMPVFEGEQKTIEHYKTEIAPVFQDAMDLINEGRVAEGFGEFSRLPVWTSQVVYTGGMGLVSPGETAQTTVRLEPGLYVMECYVKTNGTFHSVRGMVTQFIVKEESSNAAPPKKTTLNMTLSSDEGIQVEGNLRPGLQTIAVHFKDQVVHENAVGHDVNLVKLEDDTDMEELENWMNWVNPTGLETSTLPASVTFLGGVQEMPAGNTAYLTMVLKPGLYAWISEVPNSSSKGMLRTFIIPAAN